MRECVRENMQMGMPAHKSSHMDMPTSHCGGRWWGLWVAGGGCGCTGGQVGRWAGLFAWHEGVQAGVDSWAGSLEGMGAWVGWVGVWVGRQVGMSAWAMV